MKRAAWSLLTTALVLCGLASLCWADVSLPDTMKDIPLFEGSKIVSSMSQEEAQVVTVDAAGEPKKVKEFYKNTLPKAGWKIEMEMENNDMSLIAFSKDEWKLMITANKTGDARVAYSLARSKD